VKRVQYNAYIYMVQKYFRNISMIFLNTFFHSIAKYAFRRCYGYLRNSIIEDIGRETYI